MIINARGAAMTEFVMFLPIWIVCIIGIINLGQAGVDSTAVILTANSGLWKDAIEVTTLGPDQPGEFPHALPTAAGADKGIQLGEIATREGNAHAIVDGQEALTHGAALAMGHWGEGSASVQGFRFAPHTLYLSARQPVETVTSDPEEILGSRASRAYPHLLLNDQLGEQNFQDSGGNGIGQIAGLVTGSGLVAAYGAGARYGDVFSSQERKISWLKGMPEVTARSHFDMAVAPAPIHPIQFDTVTFGVAWVMTQTVDYYEVMPRFGKLEFSDTAGAKSEGEIPKTGGSEMPEQQDYCDAMPDDPDCQ